MRLRGLLIFACMATVAAGQAVAQPVLHTTTTVAPAHGPLKILPHHKKKICRTRSYHHHRSTKCWYH